MLPWQMFSLNTGLAEGGSLTQRRTGRAVIRSHYFYVSSSLKMLQGLLDGVNFSGKDRAIRLMGTSVFFLYT